MIYASGEALSTALTAEEVDMGFLYPDISRIREVSVVVARCVIRAAQADRVDREPQLDDLSDAEMETWIKSRMYDPHVQSELIKREVEDLIVATVNAHQEKRAAQL